MGSGNPQQDLNTLIGVIERNQQSLAHLGSQITTLKVEIAAQQNLCRIEHKGVTEGLFRLSEELITMLEEHNELLVSVGNALREHSSKSEQNTPAIMDTIKSVQKRDDWIRIFMVVISSVAGLMSAIIVALGTTMNSNIKTLIPLLEKLLTKFPH